MQIRTFLAACGFAVTLGSAHAGAPTYAGFELQARSNLLVNDNGFNLPPGSSFNSISPSINDAAEVAFPVGVVPAAGGSHPGVWFGSNGSGSLVFEGPAGAFISSASPLNAGGAIVFELSSTGSTDGLYVYDPLGGMTAPLDTFPVIANSYAAQVINASGAIGYQANFSSGRVYAVTDPSGTEIYVGDSGVVVGSPYTYLYTPSFNDSAHIAAKVATSSDQFSEVQIRLFTGPDTSVPILLNQATDPQSPYTKFDNSLGLNNDDVITVVATRASDDRRVVLRTDGSTTIEIAEVDPAGPILEIEYFAPVINDSGWVAFRARDTEGQAIYIGNGDQLMRVVGEGDVVQTDLGVAQIGQHNESPIFSGRPAINARGDIAFIAGLHPQGDNQTEWGSGVFVAYATDPNDLIFANGFEIAAP